MIRHAPPSVPSRCGKKPPCGGIPCWKCPPTGVGSPGEPASVRFQLTYTCNSATYAPCYCPAKPICPKAEVAAAPKSVCCCLKWVDCCGKPVN